MKRANVSGGGLFLLTVAVLACASGGASAPSPVPLQGGAWGGDGATLLVDGGTVAIEWACASGTIDKVPTLDAANRFEAEGRYRQARPGPTRPDQEAGAPARFAGAVSEDVLTLTVTLLPSGESVGTFVFTHGKKTVVRKCL